MVVLQRALQVTNLMLLLVNLPTIQTQPVAQQEFCVGSNFSLSVSCITMQILISGLKNNVEIPGETSKTYTKNISASDAGYL
jgi:putative copper export protein